MNGDKKDLIQKLRGQRYTYQAIGNLLNLTRQRVHQIYTNYACTKKYIRESAKSRDGGICVICGSNENIEIHHINGIKNDNRLSNLATLCRKCHVSMMKGKKFNVLHIDNCITLVCIQCGKTFKVTPSRKNAKFCSKKCYFVNHNVILKCLTCGKKFEIIKGIYNRQKAKYCSRECYRKSFIEN